MSGRAARSVTPGRPLITQQRRLSLELLAGKMIEFAMVINADDAKLFEMIEQCAAVWREAMRLDEATVKVRRSGGDPAQVKELKARSTQLVREACGLEWKIAFFNVSSRTGYEAKVSAIRLANFDDCDLVAIAWQLGREAEQLGIVETPEIASRFRR